MTKGIIGGMTDYRNESFENILIELKEEQKIVIKITDDIKSNLDLLKTNLYWKKNVPNNFKSIIAYAITFYNTVIDEFEDILKGLIIKVEEHQINRLRRISTIASEINIKIGTIWHQKYNNKEYGNKKFLIVENIYRDTRDLSVNLLDASNIAERLNDFIGKENFKMKKNSPWNSGTFYLTISVIIILLLAVLSSTVNWNILLTIIIASMLILLIVGILQLKNDDKITDKTFSSLIKEVLKKIPLLKQNKK